jgi:hypothetical protein
MSVERQQRTEGEMEAEFDLQGQRNDLTQRQLQQHLSLTLNPSSTNFIDDIYLWYRRIWHGDTLNNEDLRRILLEPPQYPQQDYELGAGNGMNATQQQQFDSYQQQQFDAMYSPRGGTSLMPTSSVFELSQAQSIPQSASPILSSSGGSGGRMNAINLQSLPQARPTFSKQASISTATPNNKFFTQQQQQRSYSNSFQSPSLNATTTAVPNASINFLTSPQPQQQQVQSQPHFPMEFSQQVSRRFGAFSGDFQSGLFNGIPK